MVNTDLVCCGGNGGRMKAKFTIVNFPKTIWFIAGISKLCLFSWHLVALFEMRSLSVTLLNTYTCIFSAASLVFSFFRAKQYSRDVTVTQTIFAFIRGKSTVNSGFQGIIRLHLMFVFHFWVEHKFRSKSFNSSVFLFRVATFFLSIVLIWILVGTLFFKKPSCSFHSRVPPFLNRFVIPPGGFSDDHGREVIQHRPLIFGRENNGIETV